jgi:hypothetical protein
MSLSQYSLKTKIHCKNDTRKNTSISTKYKIIIDVFLTEQHKYSKYKFNMHLITVLPLLALLVYTQLLTPLFTVVFTPFEVCNSFVMSVF